MPVPPKAVESVVVAETTPLIAWRLPVRVPMVTVPVAVRFASERLPEKSALPWRERSEDGVVVPMPTLPEALIVKRCTPAVENARMPVPESHIPVLVSFSKEKAGAPTIPASSRA